MTAFGEIQGTRFTTRTAHRQWLMNESLSLIRLFQTVAFNPEGGFFTLDAQGRPNPPATPASGDVRVLHDTTRMVHCFSIAHLMGLPGAERLY